MKIVQLGPYPPPHGGVQTNLVAIRDYLRQQGHSCAVINITRHRKEESDEVYYPEGALELLWDLVKRRYDVVHLHVGGGMPLRVCALALACASVPWTKAVFTLHSGGFPASPEGCSTTPSSFRGFALRRFDFLIGVNAEIVNFFKRVGVAAAKTEVIAPHSFTTARIAEQLSEPLASFFQRFDKVLVAVCGLEPEYDIANQIRALEHVLPKCPSTGLAILGSGTLEEDLRKQIAATSYAENILLCGDVPHAETLKAIVESDALLRTTLYDGDAISIREALYLGTPVIATDNGMRPESVHLVPMQDAVALSACICRLLSQPKDKEPTGRKDEQNVAQVVEIYQQLTTGKH